MTPTTKEITDATIEAIYWWNRTEHYYHECLLNLEEISKDKDLLNFFTQKVFEPFLKEYSIRRNIPKGYESVDLFLIELNKTKFIKDVKKGTIATIDQTSGELKKVKKLLKNETKSLLSKIAFLLNPGVFSLYDSQTKKSLWESNKGIKKVSQKALNEYSIFYKEIEALRLRLIENGTFLTAKKILENYKKTLAYTFFNQNEKAFELRVIDKLLWIRGQKETSRPITNIAYSKLLKF